MCGFKYPLEWDLGPLRQDQQFRGSTRHMYHLHQKDFLSKIGPNFSQGFQGSIYPGNVLLSAAMSELIQTCNRFQH